MNKMDMPIMTVPRSLLFKTNHFDGFQDADKMDFLRVILENYAWTRRGDAESDSLLKQPIAYSIIVQNHSRKIFAYQRSSHAYDESRLAGKWSWGIGGHIDKSDGHCQDPIQASLLRELEEEVAIESCGDPLLLGYINDDSTDVGRVHFGLLYLLTTEKDSLVPRDPEIAHGAFYTLEEISDLLGSPLVAVETWSRIAHSPLCRHISPSLPA